MMYNGINSTIGYYRGRHDALNSVAAGGISGMVFRSTRGVRPAMISGGIVASIAGGWAVSFASRNEDTALLISRRSRERHFSSTRRSIWYYSGAEMTCAIDLRIRHSDGVLLPFRQCTNTITPLPGFGNPDGNHELWVSAVYLLTTLNSVA